MSEDGAPITALCVDDDPGVLELTATCIERESDRIRVITETNAEAALDRIADGEVDCVVSDYEMPGTDGLALLGSVRALQPDLPFVLFTGRGSEAVASEAVSAGVTDYLRKNGTDQYRLLVNRIENAVDRWRAERGLERRSAAMDALDDGVAIFDDEGRYVEVNGAYARAYGLDPDALVGRHWWELLPETEAIRLRRVALPTVEREGSWSGAAAGLRPDGPAFVRQLRLVALHDGHLSVVTPLDEPAGGPVRAPTDGSPVDRPADATARLATARERIETALETGDDAPLVEALDAVDRVETALAGDAERVASRQMGDARAPASLTAVARAAWEGIDADAELAVAEDCRLAAPTRFGHVLELLLWRLVGHDGEGRDEPTVEDEGPSASADDARAIRVEVGPTDRGISVAIDGSRSDDGLRSGDGDLLGDVGAVAEAHGWEMDATTGPDGVRVEIRSGSGGSTEG